MTPEITPPAASETPTTAENESEADDEEEVRELRLRFTGSAGEYFRIWIVNVCLTLFTLGIFSAWAKVRKKRYLYSHTLLDGTPFQYLGRPLPILKGRLLAAALAALWWASDFAPALSPLVLLGAAVLLPWILLRSAVFNTRSSAFRNIRFDFSGSYRSAARAIYVGMLYMLVTLGFAFPLVRHRLTRYVVERTSFAEERAEFRLPRSGFVRSHLAAALIVVAGVILTGVTGYAFTHSLAHWAFPLVLLPTYLGYAVAFAHIRARTQNLTWNRTRLGPFEFRSRLSTRRLLVLYVTNAIAVVASLGLLVPWAVIRSAKYRIKCLRVFAAGDLDALRGTQTAAGSAAGAEVGDFFELEVSL